MRQRLLFLCLLNFVAAVEPLADTAFAAGSIKHLLAKKVGEAVCFTGQSTGLSVNVWDYAKAKQVPVPGLFRFGEPVMRPEPAVYSDQEVTSLTVLLYRDGRQHESYDEMHDFELQVTLKGWQHALSAAGECPWAGPKKSRLFTDEPHPATLVCGIDCDGGSMRIERVAGTGDVIFRFDAAGGGLRMSSGCSAGPLHAGGEARPFEPNERLVRKNPAAFRLRSMSKEACAAFRLTRKNPE